MSDMEQDYQSDTDNEGNDIEDPQSPADNIINNKIKILTIEDVEKEVNEKCGETSAVLGLPVQSCKVLLNIFHWDKDKLLEKFFESESPEKFFSSYKIRLSTLDSSEIMSKIGDCYICFDTKSIVGLQCGHLYCKDCWGSYLSTRFREENEAFPSCIDPECKMIADDSSILKLLSSEAEKRFYKKLVVKTVVNSNPLLKWCPGNDCELIAKCLTSGCQAIGDCYICFDAKSIVGLQCGHLYCKECWGSYLSTRFREENEAFPSCIDPECKMIADDSSILKLLSSEAEKRFYKKLVIKTVVNSNPRLKWCPGNDCELIAKCLTSGCQAVQCKCGTFFCFLCNHEAHEPVPCSIIKRWIKKCEGDSLTMKWISSSTKDCPKCGIPIEKNGGCNRMVCKNNSCNFQFCWSCLKDWNVHGYEGANSCNRYEPNEKEKTESRLVLQRYLHYYDRFINHKNSLKAEATLVQNINIKIGQMQSKKCYSWIETQFLIKALESLQKCRRLLIYAFAYYLPTNNSKTLFEDNQSDLERATEELSGLLEQEMDLEKDDFSVLKQKVQDRYRYVDHRLEVMLKHCHEGLERGEFVFISGD
uniref:RBR-type E3 ubiquitin transferase n=1 Tax=Panagrolaimus sp. ES5 TaxID=591445 RepID=A0AC34FC49_9BILA